MSVLVVLSTRGSIMLQAASGDCDGEGCRRKGGGMVSVEIASTDPAAEGTRLLCGDCFERLLGQA